MMLPPGLEGELRETSSGGQEHSWKPISQYKLFTNAFIWDPSERKILLGYKKRGFGKGFYNGFGGKVDESESALEAALRELKEEAEIDAPLEHCGTLLFVVDDVDYAHVCEIYRAESFTGTLQETDEMVPEWFALPDFASTSSDKHPTTSNPTSQAIGTLSPIPFHQMWPDDEYWFPLLLTKKYFKGRFDVGKNGDQDVLTRWWVGVGEDPRSQEK